jgi:hypothetical protein
MRRHGKHRWRSPAPSVSGAPPPRFPSSSFLLSRPPTRSAYPHRYFPPDINPIPLRLSLVATRPPAPTAAPARTRSSGGPMATAVASQPRHLPLGAGSEPRCTSRLVRPLFLTLSVPLVVLVLLYGAAIG